MKILLIAILAISQNTLSAQYSVESSSYLRDTSMASFNRYFKAPLINVYNINSAMLTNKTSGSSDADYTADHLPGLFCRMEYNIEKKSKLAPRFRLGSLNYTDWMEGKGNLFQRY